LYQLCVGLRYRHTKAKPRFAATFGLLTIFFSATCFLGLLLSVPIAYAQDSIAINFPIDSSKRLSPEDLAQKKENWYVTGFPTLSYDPQAGISFGVTGTVFNNGKRGHPLFAYTTYKQAFTFDVYTTSNRDRSVTFSFDAPYFLNKQIRVGAAIGYFSSPNNLYFGLNQASLQPLRHPTTGKQFTKSGSETAYSQYLESLAKSRNGKGAEPALVTDALFNAWQSEVGFLTFGVERVFWKGKGRVMLWPELSAGQVTTFDNNPTQATTAQGEEIEVPNGQTLLQRDVSNNLTKGLGYSWQSLINSCLAYDTRDLEPDPSRGWLIEIAPSASPSFLGSTYPYTSLSIQAKHFYPILPKLLKRTILATRIGSYSTSLGTPFFMMGNIEGADEDRQGLGGENILRGYRSARFVGHRMVWAQVELRTRLAQAKVLRQHFAMLLVPFAETGTVGYKWNRLSTNGLRTSYGCGIRFAWNQATILYADYAFSPEDRQLFLGLGHPF